MTLGCLLLISQPIPAAGPVYTWTDPDGITHFSETPPDAHDLETRLIEVDPAPAATARPGDDYFSIVRQAERMEARRLENERIQAESLRARAEASRAQAEANAASQPVYAPTGSDDSNRYVPVYPLSGRFHRPGQFRPGYKPEYGHRPGYGYRPGRRPVNRPGTTSIRLPIEAASRPAPRRPVSAAIGGR